MTPISGSTKTIAIFALLGPLLGTALCVLLSYSQSNGISNDWLAFLVYAGPMIGFVPAFLAGAAFLVLSRIQVSRKGVSSWATLIASGATAGALSTYFFISIFQFSADVLQSFAIVGAISGAICGALCHTQSQL
jgi:hypothetical protein